MGFSALPYYEKRKKIVSVSFCNPEKNDTILSQKTIFGADFLVQNEKNKLF